MNGINSLFSEDYLDSYIEELNGSEELAALAQDFFAELPHNLQD